MSKQLIKIIISLLLVVISLLLKFDTELYSNILYVIAYIIVGYDIVLKAVRNIFKGKVFDENFLMTVATIGAFCIGEFPEAVAVMLFYQIGELFQSYAVDRSRKSVASLMDIRPDYANVYREDEIERVDPDEVNIGEIILVKPGEKIPLDGIVVDGESMLNTQALTGESVPRKVTVNDEVLSGCINNDGILKIKVSKDFEESTVSKILDLVENASSRKSKSENFISKFAKYYTPIVVIVSVALAVIPPLVIKEALFSDWLYRALSFLVVSCPCALVISIPLSFFGGIGAASKIGVLIKGSNYLEALASAEIVVCDKTGTLTEGVFKVQKIKAIGYSDDELLRYAAYAEGFSNHPISISLKQAYNKEINEKLVTETQEISGKGVLAKVDGKMVLVGNEKIMKEYNIKFQKSEETGTIVYVAINDEFAGTILIADKIKEDSYKAVKLFKNNNVKKVVMLTGDRDNISESVANELNLDEYHAELLPQDKVSWVEKLMTQKSSGGKLIFVGDGINDAPVLALSDIGVAMGGLGSDAAIEVADVVIMTDEPSKIANSVQISKKTMRIVKQNIVFAIAVKIGVLILSAFGVSTMWEAVFADVGVSVLAIVNALRVLRIKNTYNNR
ncbi:MAG TPA: cadmium-translocating P-type ATPase [Candidatus Coprovivens excrementavium]|nr:cadmium-translocating P-type ATPase [Candidatus Coprovivens excrementavium]